MYVHTIHILYIALKSSDLSVPDDSYPATSAVNQEVDRYANAEMALILSLPRSYVYNEVPIHILFFHLIDQVIELLQFQRLELFPQCENLKASNIHNINLLSIHQINELSKYSSASILVTLSPLFTWINHSILRALVSCCSKAIKLLDEFDYNLDPLQPITSYPIPCLSLDMIPNDNSTYTILAIRCKVELYEASLQYVYDMQSLMVEKCDITQHCLQLIAIRSNPTIFYWTIPKCVVHLIGTDVPLHSECLYSVGILEVLIYPDLLLSTCDDICIGSLAFVCKNQLLSEKVCNYTYTYVYVYVQICDWI